MIKVNGQPLVAEGRIDQRVVQTCGGQTPVTPSMKRLLGVFEPGEVLTAREAALRSGHLCRHCGRGKVPSGVVQRLMDLCVRGDLVQSHQRSPSGKTMRVFGRPERA